MNILDDEAGLRSLISEANDLQRHLGLAYNNIPFGIRRPRRLVEGKAGRWVIYQPEWPTREWTADTFMEHLGELRDLVQRHADRIAHQRRMDDLNARVRELLGDADFEFYTSTLIGYGSPRG